MDKQFLYCILSYHNFLVNNFVVVVKFSMNLVFLTNVLSKKSKDL